MNEAGWWQSALNKVAGGTRAWQARQEGAATGPPPAVQGLKWQEPPQPTPSPWCPPATGVGPLLAAPGGGEDLKNPSQSLPSCCCFCAQTPPANHGCNTLAGEVSASQVTTHTCVCPLPPAGQGTPLQGLHFSVVPTPGKLRGSGGRWLENTVMPAECSCSCPIHRVASGTASSLCLGQRCSAGAVHTWDPGLLGGDPEWETPL